MKHKFIVHLHYFDGCYRCTITMPYYFTKLSEACLYGEYRYRITETIEYYEIEKYENIEKYSFYKLK